MNILRTNSRVRSVLMGLGLLAALDAASPGMAEPPPVAFEPPAIVAIGRWVGRFFFFNDSVLRDPKDLSSDGTVSLFGSSIVRRTTPGMSYEADERVTAPLFAPPVSFVNPSALSADGRVVVGTQIGFLNNVPNIRAYRWRTPRGQDQGLLEELLPISDAITYSEALGVSDDGRIVVGRSANAAGFTAVTWGLDNQPVDLGYIPGSFEIAENRAIDASRDGSVIVGWGFSDRGVRWWRWTTQTGMVPVEPMTPGRGRAAAVTPDGRTVIGNDQVETNLSTHRGWIWTTTGGYTAIPALPEYPDYSIPTSVSDDGSTVYGYAYSNALGSSRAFAWDRTHGTRALRDALIADYGMDLSNWPELKHVAAVSGDGRTVLGVGDFWFTTSNPEVDGGGSDVPFFAYLPTNRGACRADFNGDGAVDPDDLADVIACFFGADPACPSVDFSGDGVIDPDDLSDYITAFFSGC